jgi:hypothetical protein
MPYLRGLDVFPPDDAIVSSREADTIEGKTNEKKIVNISLILNFIVIIEIDTRDFSSGRTCKGKKQRCKPLCKGKIQKIDSIWLSDRPFEVSSFIFEFFH